MTTFIEDIIEFNKVILGINKPNKKLLSFADAEFSFECLTEEALEFRLANLTNNYIDSVDALIDSIYFAIGALYKLGLTADEIEKAMKIVHQANMKKSKGINNKRNTGSIDAIKPKDWKAPENALFQLLNKGGDLIKYSVLIP